MTFFEIAYSSLPGCMGCDCSPQSRYEAHCWKARVLDWIVWPAKKISFYVELNYFYKSRGNYLDLDTIK